MPHCLMCVCDENEADMHTEPDHRRDSPFEPMASDPDSADAAALDKVERWSCCRLQPTLAPFASSDHPLARCRRCHPATLDGRWMQRKSGGRECSEARTVRSGKTSYRLPAMYRQEERNPYGSCVGHQPCIQQHTPPSSPSQARTQLSPVHMQCVDNDAETTLRQVRNPSGRVCGMAARRPWNGPSCSHLIVLGSSWSSLRPAQASGPRQSAEYNTCTFSEAFLRIRCIADELHYVKSPSALS